MCPCQNGQMREKAPRISTHFNSVAIFRSVFVLIFVEKKPINTHRQSDLRLIIMSSHPMQVVEKTLTKFFLYILGLIIHHCILTLMFWSLSCFSSFIWFCLESPLLVVDASADKADNELRRFGTNLILGSPTTSVALQAKQKVFYQLLVRKSKLIFKRTKILQELQMN